MGHYIGTMKIIDLRECDLVEYAGKQFVDIYADFVFKPEEESC